VLVGVPFTARTEDGHEEKLDRYDALHLLDIDEITRSVRFQKIRPGKKNFGWHEKYPVFSMAADELSSKLRPHTEAMRAMVEGMALAKPFELLLRRGEVKVDVDARVQWKQRLPLVRRVKHGGFHLMITYDPKVVYGAQPREIVLEDFDGVAGRTLRLPADAETRLFVLRER
jgi:hypothetical protein